MNANIQVVTQLSKVDVWNQYSQQMQKNYNGKEDEIFQVMYILKDFAML